VLLEIFCESGNLVRKILGPFYKPFVFFLLMLVCMRAYSACSPSMPVTGTAYGFTPVCATRNEAIYDCQQAQGVFVTLVWTTPSQLTCGNSTTVSAGYNYYTVDPLLAPSTTPAVVSASGVRYLPPVSDVGLSENNLILNQLVNVGDLIRVQVVTQNLLVYCLVVFVFFLGLFFGRKGNSR